MTVHQTETSLFLRPFPDWIARLLIAVLGGVLAGIVIGAFVYPLLVTAFDPTLDGAFRSKRQAGLRALGIPNGAWIGGVAGLVFNVLRSIIMRAKRTIA